MGETTAIAWTDHTFNPWWGCVKISPACDGCYAERDAHRYGFADGGGNGPELWGKNAERRHLTDGHWAKPLAWDRAAAAAGRPALVFCASMADVFEARDDLDPLRDRLWTLIEATPHLIWQLLTKRPEQILRRVPPRWLGIDDRFAPITDLDERRKWAARPQAAAAWPANVWIGTTVEDQARADLRIPRLLEVPAPVRFLSAEPLLGPVDHDLAGIAWVIVGGESGPNARPMHPGWARALRDRCVRRRTLSCIHGGRIHRWQPGESCPPYGPIVPTPGEAAFFFKQWGEWAPGRGDRQRLFLRYDGGQTAIDSGDVVEVVRVGRKAAGDELDGRRWQEFPAGVVR